MDPLWCCVVCCISVSVVDDAMWSTWRTATAALRRKQGAGRPSNSLKVVV